MHHLMHHHGFLELLQLHAELRAVALVVAPALRTLGSRSLASALAEIGPRRAPPRTVQGRADALADALVKSAYRFERRLDDARNAFAQIAEKTQY